MSFRSLLGTLTLSVGLAFPIAGPADAFGEHARSPAGWGKARDVDRHVSYSRYRHYDRYAYRYSPRGYYPYYNSGYWVPTSVLRERRDYRLQHAEPGWRFRYHAAWGYPRRNWNHVRWHSEHHGRHHIGHW